jgi:hypothetical protein
MYSKKHLRLGSTGVNYCVSIKDEYLARFNLPKIGLPPDSQWSILLKFFRWRRFSRLWILQEVALARELEVLCGCSTLDWESIVSCATVMGQQIEAVIVIFFQTLGVIRAQRGLNRNDYVLVC